MASLVRRVEVGTVDGRDVIISDGPAPGAAGSDQGPWFARILWSAGWPTTADDGGDEPERFALEPPVGGLCTRVIRLPPPPPGRPTDEGWLRVPGDHPDRPGMHTTDTLDLMVVIDGEIVLGLDDGDRRVGPGDLVVQRGTAHRWRVVGDRPCTYAVTMLRPDPHRPLPPEPLGLPPGATGGAQAGRAPGALRRVVTATGEGGRSFALHDGAPPGLLAGQVTLADVWQTGAPLSASQQGGDTGAGWVLDPLGLGAAMRVVEWPRGAEPGDDGWHATPTIDVDFVLSGQLELRLRGGLSTELRPGDVVVQRGNEHQWRPLGEHPVRLVSVMIGLTLAT